MLLVSLVILGLIWGPLIIGSSPAMTRERKWVRDEMGGAFY